LRSATTDLGEPHAQIAYCACECRERWSSRACSNQCKRRLFRLRGRSGHSWRRRRGRDRWERDSEQSSASTTGLLSAPTPRLSSASARSGLSASAGLCSAGTRLSLGTRARLGRRLRLSAAHRTGVPIIGPYYAKICRLEEDAQGSGPPYGGQPTFSGARGSAARWRRRKMRRLDRRSDQEAFLKAWLTLRVADSTLSPAIFCPSAVSSLILFVEHRNLLSGVCRQDRMMTSRSRVGGKTRKLRWCSPQPCRYSLASYVLRPSCSEGHV
jgi:hypothetical protein